MVKPATATVLCVLGLACALIKPRPTPPLEGNPFPVEEAGSLDLPGRVLFALAGPENRVFLVLDNGDLICLDAAEKRAVWTYRVDSPVTTAPSLGGRNVYLCDEKNVLHAVDFDGLLIFRKPLGQTVTSPPAEHGGCLFLGADGGFLLALDIAKKGEPLWTYSAAGPVRAAPAFWGNRIFFGDESGTLHGLDLEGRTIWTFKSQGKIVTSPAVSAGRVLFGTDNSLFCCLDAVKGKKKWLFRLDGGPVRPPLVAGKRVVFAASNSVVYCLSLRRGEILWWKPLPSRILFKPLVLGETVVVSSATSEIKALDLKSGQEAGSVNVAGEVSGDVLWTPSGLAVITGNSSWAADRAVFLKSQSRPPASGVEPKP